MIKISKNKKILLIVVSLVVIAIIVYFAISIGARSPSSTKTNNKSGESGKATLVDTTKKTNNEWGEVPATDQLALMASNQNGGSIGRIAYVKGLSEVVYSKVEIFGDENTVYIFFKYDGQWASINDSDVPKDVATELNSKLSSPQKR